MTRSNMQDDDNEAGLLVGPLPHVRTPSGHWAPDYRHPGVAARVRAEVDLTEALCWRKGRD